MLSIKKNPFYFSFPLVILLCFISHFPVDAKENKVISKPPESSGLPSSASCGTEDCHTRIFKEWSKTMHSQSSPQKDPLVKAFYGYLAKENYDTGECDVCHVPMRSVYSKEKEKNSAFFDEGVNCVFCHSIYGKTAEGGKGLHYYHLDFLKPLTGPTKTGKEAHDAEFIGMFKKVDICAGCHQNGEMEYATKGKTKSPCQQCHMPSKKKLKSADMGKVREKVHRHLFEGGHSELLLSMAVIVSGEARRDGGKTIVVITLENPSLHPIPIGFPLRAIYMKVVGLDENEEPVWTNYQANPKKEAADAYFALFFPEEDEVYVHCVKDIKPVKDTRLQASSTREFSLEVPSEKIETLQVQLFYRLLPETILKKLNVDEAHAPEVLMLEETIYVD